MAGDYETRACHHCGRQSRIVALGASCPWCGRKTGKHTHYLAPALMAVVYVVGLIAIIYTLVNI